jgi:hypothetical protein
MQWIHVCFLIYLTFYLTTESQFKNKSLFYNDVLHRPIPYDAGPIGRRPMGLSITAGCDRAWNRIRVSVVTPLALRCSALDRCDTAWNRTRVSVVTPLALRCSALDHCDTAWNRTRVSVVTPLALRCSASDRRATREPMCIVFNCNAMILPNLWY